MPSRTWSQIAADFVGADAQAERLDRVARAVGDAELIERGDLAEGQAGQVGSRVVLDARGQDFGVVGRVERVLA